MDLKEIGEFGWIDRIRRKIPVRDDRVVRAIGDDAAVIRFDGRHWMLLTTDMLVERVHFNRSWCTGAELGHKALAVNLSDIAAMGGEPLDAFVSLAVPPGCDLDYLDGLYSGIRQLADRFAVAILGGDTTGSKVDLIVNIALTGRVEKNRALFRNTARPGDTIFCTGSLGESRAGLYLLTNDVAVDSEEMAALRSAHILPRPQVAEGRFLAAAGVHAVIDVSDGLSSDLGHIVRESRVGARIFADRIPVSRPLVAFCERFGHDPLATALAGGEDFVLLGTVGAESAEAVAQGFEEAFQRPLHRIGEVTGPGTLEWIDHSGKPHALAPAGWDHFRPDVPQTG